MANITTENTATSLRDVWERFISNLAHRFERHMHIRSRRDEIEALEAKSDAELARMGIRRDGIASRVPGQVLHLTGSAHQAYGPVGQDPTGPFSCCIAATHRARDTLAWFSRRNDALPLLSSGGAHSPEGRGDPMTEAECKSTICPGLAARPGSFHDRARAGHECLHAQPTALSSVARLHGMTDRQLAAMGLTRADIPAFVFEDLLTD